MLQILNSHDHNLAGSTACCIDNKVYVIGGYNGRPAIHNHLLQIHCIDLETKTWIPVYNNTSGIMNRSFHCSCVLNKEIYLFGGTTVSGELSQQSSNEVIIVRNSNLGLVSTVHSLEESVRRQGQTACIMGNSKKAVILFGGMSSDKDSSNNKAALTSFPTNVSSFSNLSGSYMLSPVEVAVGGEDEMPTGRAFHTAVVCGAENEFMIICGGRNGNKILNDLWLLDMSALLNAAEVPAVVVVPQGKTDAKKTDAKKGTVPSVPSAKWKKLKLPDENLLLPRQLHSSYFLHQKNSSAHSGRICIFGGVGEYGSLSSKIVQFQFSIIDTIPTVSEISDDDTHSVGLQDDNLETVKSAAVTLFYGNNSNRSNTDSPLLPLAFLVFGGVYQRNCVTVSSESRMIVFEEENNILFKHEILEETEEAKEEENKNASSDEAELINIMRYEGETKNGQRHGNGRLYKNYILIYEGQFRNNEYHGEGKLWEENGDIYEGEFSEGLKDGFGLLTKVNKSVYKGDWSADKMLDGNYVTNYPITIVRNKNKNELFNKSLKSVSSEYHTNNYNNNNNFNNFNNESNRNDFICMNRNEFNACNGLYEGQIMGGVPCDMDGICRYTDGGEYRGNWKSGRRNGQGTYTSVKGDTYRGKWVADERSGRGSWISKTGGSYDGLWDSDYPHGSGVRKYSDKSSYSGNFHGGKRCGKGSMMTTDDVVHTGIWDNDCLLDEI